MTHGESLFRRRLSFYARLAQCDKTAICAFKKYGPEKLPKSGLWAGGAGAP